MVKWSRFLGGLLAGFCLVLVARAQPIRPPQLLPQPRELVWESGKFRLERDFSVSIRRYYPTRMEAAVDRFLKRLDGRTQLGISQQPTDKLFPLSGLNVSVGQRADLSGEDDESYTLEISPKQMVLRSGADLGALRGLETLLQLLDADSLGYFFPACRITDAPAFAWRGIMLDPARRFLPVESLHRTLDAMAVVGLNVLHLRLSGDQGFRLESKLHPWLHEMGSGGAYYSQTQIKDLVAHADALGIRVVPELDLPGQCTAWLVGHPELASAPGPYALPDSYGLCRGVMDPTKPEVFQFLESLWGELSGMFPDRWVHVGGSAIDPTQWDNHPGLPAFMEANQLDIYPEVQGWMVAQVAGMLRENGKTLVVSNEVPGMPVPEGALTQFTRTPEEWAAGKGIYSLGWAAGNGQRNWDLWQDSNSLFKQTKGRPEWAGGELMLPGYFVGAENLDLRLWPQAAVVAARLWSGEVEWTQEELSERLARVSYALEEAGGLHRVQQEQGIRRVCRGYDCASVEVLLRLCKSLTDPARLKAENPSPQSTLGRWADLASPDSPQVREFEDLVQRYLDDPNPLNRFVLEGELKVWRDNQANLVRLSEKIPAVKTLVPLGESLAALGKTGLELLEMQGSPVFARKKALADSLLRAEDSHGGLQLAVLEGMNKLLKSTYGL